MSEIRNYQVLSPIKFGGRVYRGGTAELPERIGNELVRSGRLAELPAEPPKAPSDTVTNHPESQPAIAEAGTGDSGAAVTSKPAGGAPPADAEEAPVVAPPRKPRKAKESQ